MVEHQSLGKEINTFPLGIFPLKFGESILSSNRLWPFQISPDWIVSTLLRASRCKNFSSIR